MKKIFCDQNKNVFLKVLANSTRAGREMAGAKALAKYVTVPETDLIDSKTLVVKKVMGVKSTLVPKKKLASLLFDYFLNIKPVGDDEIDENFTIDQELENLIGLFSNRPAVTDSLTSVLKTVAVLPKFPIHGDLQKQNIFLSNDRLTFIDFEHFCLAPLELELVNSFFFNDKNCLDTPGILEKLEGSGKMDRKVIGQMILFYVIKQIASGRNLSDAKMRFERAIGKLGVKLTFPDFKTVTTNFLFSSCFA